MEVTFIGATQTVTGSLHLFEHNQQKFLLECGMYQGHREEAERINQTFPFKPKDIKAVILSHAHIDHSGNLPNLVKRGFNGPIFCTSATRDIASLLLLDSAKIQENDYAYVNKKRRTKGLPDKEPLYRVEDAERALKHFQPVEYTESFSPVPGVTVSRPQESNSKNRVNARACGEHCYHRTSGGAERLCFKEHRNPTDAVTQIDARELLPSLRLANVFRAMFARAGRQEGTEE